MAVAVLPLVTFAQRKISSPAAIWPEVQLNYSVGEEGMLFFQNQYRINTDGRFNDLAEQGPFSGFERVQLVLGYEHTLTEHWRGGGLVRYAYEDFPKQQFYTLFVRHNGNIKSLYFNKQIMFEYWTKQLQEASGRFRIMAELGRRTEVGEKFLTPALSYEAIFLKEFEEQPVPNDARTIARTRLRLGATLELTEQLRLTPYFIRQTDYYNVLAKYDENNVLVEEAHKVNRISPIIGLELKYNFNGPANTASITY
ncbi:DUF2490 domain-containing protein [Botryobacter ruber]|uniref:DUF2490 domain-containing protein n=1 Tax=Botryobacter ruber TaxID=2171629 RepID=UPI0013E2C4A9|nr:DUF2490 domain-containing protein [Botryobacter ruber]